MNIFLLCLHTLFLYYSKFLLPMKHIHLLQPRKKLISCYNNLKIFIFSDDIKKIKREKWFDGMEATYIDDVDVCESFELLRNCKNYVCSNSSFSWWGAFLSYNENSFASFLKLNLLNKKIYIDGINTVIIV